MPDDDTQRELPVPLQPDPPATAADDTGGLSVGLLLLFVAIVALISLQNWWLRKRAENEANEPDGTDVQP